MSAKNGIERNMSEEEIDRVVVEQADDNGKWEDPIAVRMHSSTQLTIPATLAARAAFLARVHRARGLEEWLTSIIQERIELEESAFSTAKRDMTSSGLK